MTSSTSSVIKPCIKCGACDRDKRGNCRPCSSANNKAWRAANPDKDKIRKQAWHIANGGTDKVCAKCGATERYKNGACKPCAIKRRVAYELENAEKIKAMKAARRAANPELARAQAAARHAKNKEKRNAKIAEWKAKNPEARRLHVINRRARKRAAGGQLSPGLTQKLFKLQKGKCACCKQPLGDDYHLDHITPLVLGGTNTDDNMQLLRSKCNLQKSAKHPVDFMQQRGFLL